MAGIDARLNEIGEGIQEVMESYEVRVYSYTCPILYLMLCIYL